MNGREFMPQPTRHRASFESDALGMRRMLAKQAGHRAELVEYAPLICPALLLIDSALPPPP